MELHLARLLSSLDDESVKKASLQQKIWAYRALYDKEWIVRNLSTSNL